ncbi:butyrate kinase [Halothermothrix orenii]|uniref:Probable butyrate kinase n=1 Tax=Halothermothrix orenii (strain H 168 / OCM 544 / DSM 9562) TaxID=373903 RepID=B8CVW4_HALOH|nr:butyrate kinase [Halothermothrix orenii]ACL69433.1 Butyrate kinase [Halothermothrix orenii H 168]
MAEMILAINPGSTSTKLALFDGIEEVFTENITHDINVISKYKSVIEQKDCRLKYIEKFLENKGVKYNQLKAVVGRGGLLKPISGGTYEVNDRMIDDLKEARYGEHASNLGAVLAREIALKSGCQAYIVDPVVVDELNPLARLSGLPEIPRRSIFHALNQKAVARKYARSLEKNYEDMTLIVTHLGGGITVGLHRGGRVIDVNDGLSGEGPFTPNRTGGLPTYDLVKLCYSGEYTHEEMKVKLLKKGGLAGYLGTTDLREVEKMINNGDDRAEQVFLAMAYQICKEIGSLAPVANGNIDAIILTGGMAYSQRLSQIIKEKVEFIAPVVRYPGEEEMKALVEGAYRVLSGLEKVKKYH